MTPVQAMESSTFRFWPFRITIGMSWFVVRKTLAGNFLYEVNGFALSRQSFESSVTVALEAQ